MKNKKTMQPIIKLENIDYTYPNSNKGLHTISLSILEGQKTAVLGLNGAGKSTLFLLLCGVLKPQKGSYWLVDKQFQAYRLCVSRPRSATFCNDRF